MNIRLRVRRARTRTHVARTVPRVCSSVVYCCVYGYHAAVSVSFCTAGLLDYCLDSRFVVTRLRCVITRLFVGTQLRAAFSRRYVTHFTVGYPVYAPGYTHYFSHFAFRSAVTLRTLIDFTVARFTHPRFVLAQLHVVCTLLRFRYGLRFAVDCSHALFTLFIGWLHRSLHGLRTHTCTCRLLLHARWLIRLLFCTCVYAHVAYVCVAVALIPVDCTFWLLRCAQLLLFVTRLRSLFYCTPLRLPLVYFTAFLYVVTTRCITTFAALPYGLRFGLLRFVRRGCCDSVDFRTFQLDFGLTLHGLHFVCRTHVVG